MSLAGSLVSVVITVTRLRAGRSGVRTPAEGRDFSFLQNVQTNSGGPRRPLFNEYRGSSPVLKRQRHEVYRSPLSSAEIKKEWRYTSTPPMYLRVAYRDTFSFHPLSAVTDKSLCPIILLDTNQVCVEEDWHMARKLAPSGG